MTIKRFPHYLRPATGGQWPRSILCVDCVGRQSVHMERGIPEQEVLSSWHAVLLIKEGDDYKVWTSKCGQTVAGFWDALQRLADELYPLWIFSYRASRIWNLLSLWEEIENGRIIIAERPDGERIRRSVLSSVQRKDNDTPARAPSAGNLSRMLADNPGFIVTGDTPNIVRARFAQHRHWWTWVDTQNYGVERAESIRDGASGMGWLIACVRSLVCALHTYKLGSLRPTAASQALHGFRCSYYSGGIYVGCGREENDLERSAYYGGRCECMRVGAIEGTVIAGDFASQYCRLCRDNSVPVRCKSHKRIEGGQADIPGDSCANLIATVAIETDEAAYPYRRGGLTITERIGGNRTPSSTTASADTDIIYPTGRFLTTLCGPELEDAVALGRVKRWYEWSEYEMQPALREYANAILDMRRTGERCGDTVAIQLAKRLGNSLPGKMGERNKRWTYQHDCGTDIQYGEWFSPDKGGVLQLYRSIAGVVHKQSREEWSEEAVPAIAAWVTSLGRMALLHAIRIAGWKNVCYYDTDSVFTNYHGWCLLYNIVCVRGFEAFPLRQVGVEDYAEFAGIKNYRFGDKLVCAGMPRDKSAPNYNGWSYVHNPTATEYIRKGERPIQQEVIVRVARDQVYRHGVVGADGRVSPIILEEW